MEEVGKEKVVIHKYVENEDSKDLEGLSLVGARC